MQYIVPGRTPRGRNASSTPDAFGARGVPREGESLRVGLHGPITREMKQPDAGNPRVRFDERGRETGRLAQPRPPRPYSTLPGFPFEIARNPGLRPSLETLARRNANYRVASSIPDSLQEVV